VAVASVARGDGRLLTMLVAFLGAVLGEGACLETRHSLGADCLKDGDCISGVCTQLRCAASPPTIDSRPAFAQADDDASADAPTGSTSDDGSAIAEEAINAMEDSSADIVADNEGTLD
jgi:hypothetical protein